MTLTADVIGLVPGQLVLGPLSDARGRRRLLLGSTLVCAAASVLCALAPSVPLLVRWRLVQGASGGGGIVLARAIAGGVEAAGRSGSHDGVQRGADRGAGARRGVLAWTGTWPPMFLLLAVVSAGLAAAGWRVPPETLPPSRRHGGGLRRTGWAFADLARDWAFLGYALTVAFAYASLFGYIAGSTFALDQA